MVLLLALEPLLPLEYVCFLSVCTPLESTAFCVVVELYALGATGDNVVVVVVDESDDELCARTPVVISGKERTPIRKYLIILRIPLQSPHMKSVRTEYD